jgi:hypothetical protein
LAQAIDEVGALPREATGYLSQLDQLVLKLTGAYPQLSQPHRAFAAARQNVGPVQVTDASWAELLRTAAALADAVRSLGDAEVCLCQKQTRWGTCNTALKPDVSECPYDDQPDWHVT